MMSNRFLIDPSIENHDTCATCQRKRMCAFSFSCGCDGLETADSHEYAPKSFLCGCMVCCQCGAVTIPDEMNVDGEGLTYYCNGCEHLYDNGGFLK